MSREAKHAALAASRYLSDLAKEAYANRQFDVGQELLLWADSIRSLVLESGELERLNAIIERQGLMVAQLHERIEQSSPLSLKASNSPAHIHEEIQPRK